MTNTQDDMPSTRVPVVHIDHTLTVCNVCGSPDIQIRVTGWYPANLEIATDPIPFDWDTEADQDDVWCPACDDQCIAVDITDFEATATEDEDSER